MPNSVARTAFTAVALALATLVITALLGEGMLRLKNSTGENYVIEMWRYAKELKHISPNPDLGHVHVAGATAHLQGVDFALNSLGMRGPEPVPNSATGKTVLLLGNSITLGWGVAENDTLRARLQDGLGAEFQVMNGGIGNYNTRRAVTLFREQWRAAVRPDVVVVHFFLNDAEYLPPSHDNILMRNSQLAVTLYYLAQGVLKGSSDMSALIAHYRDVYRPEAKGYREMIGALDELSQMSKQDGFRVVFSMIPDIHRLESYPFAFAHQQMRRLVGQYGWEFIDFFDGLKAFKGPELWTIPGDPHPNARVHQIMARQLLPAIRQ